MVNRDYVLLESTISMCPECMKRVDAKIIMKNNSIYLLKFCKEHGGQLELLEEDAQYFLKRNEYTKPGTISKTQTKVNLNCPFDCGLCPEHDQHTCIGLIEVTSKCDLNCPICYAKSGKDNPLSLEKIEKMMDFYQESENNNAEILQISGGEPTTHPKIIEIIKLARSKKFKYVMLNTNGLRIAEDEEFVKELSNFKGQFEVYLQFDGFDEKIHKHLRGKDLTKIKERAIQNLSKYEIPITLVTTIEKGINDNEIGKIIDFGLSNEYIRGINFQPISFSGRLKNHNIKDRITITGVLKRVEEQTNKRILQSDFVPLPCNVDRVAINYMYRSGKEFISLARSLNVKKYIPFIDNTFNFDADDIINKVKKNQSSCCGCDCFSFLNDVRKIIPKEFIFKSKDKKIKHINHNTFRISVTSFIDAYNFDIKSMKKECVHIITPDMKKIPFSSYNMVHRK
tara:strand:+ start:117 stop:1478 length:1362 start_codon:yes stop_codon:yes gene_type:complete